MIRIPLSRRGPALGAEAGRNDLARQILHVSKIEGDGAGYDIKSFTKEGEEKFIEVKTTRGNKTTAFYLSSHEARFSAERADQYYLYRVFEFEDETSSGKVFIHRGDLLTTFVLLPMQYRVLPTFD